MSSGLSFVVCTVAGVAVEFLIDSGSTVNIIPLEVWTRIEKHRENDREKHRINDFMASEEKLTVFGGGKVSVICSFRTTMEVCEANKPLVHTKILVVQGSSRAMLSKGTAEALRVLKTGIEVNKVHEGEKELDSGRFPTIPLKVVKLEIDSSVTPVQIPRVRVPIALEEPVNKRIKEMLDKGIIERAECTTSFISPMNVVAKGDGVFRIVIDMREANKAIRRKYHPLPVMENLFQKLAGARVFTILDLKSAYHQVELDPDSRDVTTFMTQLGAMRFTRLVFGMNAAPEIFQEVMDALLGDCEGCVIYLDDILIFAEDLQKLKKRTEKVLEILRANRLLLNYDKC